MTDEQYKEIYVAWARHKYQDENINDVRFSLGSHGPYSSVTPDVSEYVEIWVGYLNCPPSGLYGRTFEETDVHALIRELNEFIIDQLSRAYDVAYVEKLREARKKRPGILKGSKK